jgi:tetratricopeptide (TPR) repeat protein
MLARAQIDPSGTLIDAQRFLTSTNDPEASVTAQYALGMALRTQFVLDEAQQTLQRAADEALAAGFETLGGRALLTLSGAHAMAGKMDEAIAVVGRAREHLEGPDLSAAQAQMATMLYEQDRHEEAILEFNAAIATIRTHNALARLPLALANRANALAALGRLTEAQASLEQAWEVVDHDRAQTGMILSHLGWVAALRGDLPVALRWFEQLEQSDVPGRDDPGWLVDYAHALLESGLAEEASAVARQSLELAEEKGLRVRRQLPLRVLADASLRSGDLDAAREAARLAVEALEEIGGSVLPGRLREVEAALAAQPTVEDLDRLGNLIAEVEETDRAAEALEARVNLALTAAKLGLVERAETNLSQPALHSAPLRVQVQAWTALAYLRVAGGDLAGAGSALRAALRRAAVHRAAFGAADVRAASAGLGADAAQLGLTLAIDGGDPAQVLAWAERARSAAQRTRPVTQGADAEQRDLLARYRQISDQIRKAAGPEAGLLRDRSRLERRIRDHARTVAAEGELVSTIPSMSEVRRALDGQTFVEYVESDGEIHALVMGPKRSRLVALPGGQGVRERLQAIDLALVRVLSDRAAAAASERIESILEDLDERLVDPWRHLLGEEVTVSPIGFLHSVPWSALPSLRHLLWWPDQTSITQHRRSQHSANSGRSRRR